MKRIVLTFVLVASLISGSVATAAVKTGASCSKAGATSTISGKKFTCIKSGKKLVWDKGVVIKQKSETTTSLPIVSQEASKPKALDPKFPKQGQTCPTNSLDVIGYNNDGLLVDLMCNNWDDKYFPRPENMNPFKVDQNTGLKIEVITQVSNSAMADAVQSVKWISNAEPLTKPKSQINARSTLSDINLCKIPDAGVSGDMPANVQHHFVAGFTPYKERAPLTRTPVIQFVTVDFPDLQGKASPKEDLSKVTEFLQKYWTSQSTNKTQLEMRIPNSYIRMPKNVVDYKMNVDFFSGNWKADDAFNYVRDVVRIADSQINFTDVDVMVIAVPKEVTRSQIGAFIAESSESRFPNQGFQTDEKRIMNTLVMAGPSSSESGELLNWAHELGHNFGLSDLRTVSNVANQDSSPLGIYDLMNSAIAPELLAWNRFILGILHDDQVRCVTAGATTHLLRPVEMDTKDNKMVVIPIEKYKAIAIESRRAMGFDANLGKLSEGVLVYEIDTTIPYGTSPITIVPKSGSKDFPWRRDSALQLNDSITVSGWKIEVIESGEFGDVVKVEKM